MKRFLTRLFLADDGAISVDWVVLTAAITVLAAAGVLATENGVETVASRIEGFLSSEPVD